MTQKFSTFTCFENRTLQHCFNGIEEMERYKGTDCVTGIKERRKEEGREVGLI